MTNIDLCHERACVFALERDGFEVLDLPTRAIDAGTELALAREGAQLDNERRFRVWAAESLLVGLRAARRGDLVLAFRCALQASEYTGRLGGYLSPGLSDARAALRSFFEHELLSHRDQVEVIR